MNTHITPVEVCGKGHGNFRAVSVYRRQSKCDVTPLSTHTDDVWGKISNTNKASRNSILHLSQTEHDHFVTEITINLRHQANECDELRCCSV